MPATGRIFLFGATGYTGRLTTTALLARGARPVLVGRDARGLERLAEESRGLETAIADVDRPASLRALLGKGDVLVTTVGPFSRYGEAAIEAAIDAGAHYLDSTGEPAWIRRVFERYGPAAADRGSSLLTAIGYDYVPGNLAGALALEQAGRAATRVDVGYYATGGEPLRRTLSSGTLASLGEAVLDPALALRAGRIVEERGARRLRRYSVSGRPLPAVSIGMSEHFALPRAYPHVADVNTYLGWFGSLSRAMQVSSAVNTGLSKVPGVSRAQRSLVRRLLRGSRGGPDAVARAKVGTFVTAEAFDTHDRLLCRSELLGGNPYEFTGEILAWGAMQAARGSLNGAGALGPVDGFGLRELEQACAEIGLAAVGRAERIRDRSFAADPA
jgi:short subunit dehydrogenase-like uncharacterized protein